MYISDMTKQLAAAAFGIALDNDDFAAAKLLLADDAVYDTGNEVLEGPDAICKSYEQNMIAGRKKLDRLEWGKSKVTSLGLGEYYIHFTDYLTHNGKKYTHRCKQKVTVNGDNKIERVEHISDAEEQRKLNEYYISVGLK